jgi:hypothetical protein
MHSSVAIFSKIFLKNQEQNDPGTAGTDLFRDFSPYCPCQYFESGYMHLTARSLNKPARLLSGLPGFARSPRGDRGGFLRNRSLKGRLEASRSQIATGSDYGQRFNYCGVTG